MGHVQLTFFYFLKHFIYFCFYVLYECFACMCRKGQKRASVLLELQLLRV